jgi:sugar lactone lactonase YvrE
MTQLYQPTDIIMDFSGNFYIGSYACSWVTKWSPNATIGTLVAGSPSGVEGSDSQHLYKPYGMSIDESNSLLYVVDRYNHRVQKFVLGNLTGVTVVGGNGGGAASNQLYNPTALFISQRDHSYYICDSGNSRIQKWAVDATYGVTIAESSTGVAGGALNLLNQPYDIWVHPNETYMLISDSNNCRVQKYILY